MHYFGTDEHWQRLDDAQTRRLVDRLNAQLAQPGDAAALVVARDGEPADAAYLRVFKVWQTSLPFYGEGWHLARLACDVQPISPAHDSRGYLFAVIGPNDDCTVLDWTSAPLHRLNARLKLDLAKLQTPLVRDYLVFFCAFLGGDADGEHGATSPFVIAHDAGSFEWDDEATASGGADEQLQVFDLVHDPNAFDDPDLPAAAEGEKRSAAKPEAPHALRTAAQSKEAAKQALLRVSADAANMPPDPAEAPGGSEADPIIGAFKAVVWYRGALFEALLHVSRTGSVHMASDEPVAGADDLPARRWDVLRARHGIHLLCRTKPRESLSADDLRGRLRSIGVAGQPAPRLSGLRISDALDWPDVFKTTISLDDVHFDHDVVLDDAVFERSLNLRNCRFLRRLSLRDATIKGAFRLDNSRVLGAVAKDPQRQQQRDRPGLGTQGPLPALELRGLKVERGLFADRLVCSGRVRAQWCRVNGTFRARGLQIHPRSRVDDASLALDLSHAQIDGPLDLCGFEAKQSQPGAHQRSYLYNDAKLSGLHAAQLDLDGIRVAGSLDLASCVVAGRISLSAVSILDGLSWKVWRSFIDGDLRFDRSGCAFAVLSGMRVGGDWYLTEAKVAGSVFADVTERCRTRIAGNLIASGAMIAGDLDLQAAQVGGVIQIITGRLGRFRADIGPWRDEDGQAQLCPAEASALIIQDAAIGSSLQLAGLRLHGRNNAFASGDVLLRGVRLGGGVRFWSADIAARLRSRCKEVSPNTDDAQLDKLVAPVRADINGRIDLRGLHAQGPIDLGRLSAQAIRLDNARIGGNIRVEDGAHCTQFAADLIRVEGNVELCGLVVSAGDLSARDAAITGQLLLAKPDQANGAVSLPDRTLVKNGRVDLDGLHAARLVLSSKVIEQANSAHADFGLSRCQLGQLKVLDFTDTGSRRKFDKTLDLSAIDVGDWGLEQDDAPALLQATKPFDGRNYLDIEQRLSRLGNRAQADRIFLAMMGRAFEFPWPVRFGQLWHWAKNRANRLFSGNGTSPLRMAVWLLIALLPVVCVLREPANVEFKPSEGPSSDGRAYDLATDWGWTKAVGLTAGYALPFLGGARADVVRARLVGPTCLPWPLHTVEPAGSSRCAGGWELGISPHDLAMMFSTLQFALWILVAANLPTISRRRQ